MVMVMMEVLVFMGVVVVMERGDDEGGGSHD